MLEQYLPHIIRFVVFCVFVFAVVEVIKELIKSMPDKWGKWCNSGVSDKGQKLLSFLVGYWLSWTFDYQLANQLFEKVSKGTEILSPHTNYFLVASLLWVGSKWIYLRFKKEFKELTGRADEKQDS